MVSMTAIIKNTDWINAKIEALPVSNSHRGYLGISQLGHSCDRYLYYVHHQVAPSDQVSPRIMRIFERGHWEEQRIIRDLAAIGIPVTDTQLEIQLLGGLVRGHIDGIAEIDGVKHLLEVKTMNDTAWKSFYKHGLEKANPGYFHQCQSYATELKLAHILFVAVNKNDEARKFEILVANGVSCIDRAISIIGATEVPKRIGGSDFFTCKMCEYNEYCHFA